MTRFRLGPNAAAVFAHNAIDERETDPATFEFCAVQTLERGEELAGFVHAEADAIIQNIKSHVALHCGLIHLDLGGRLSAGVFEGIGQKVDKDLAYESRIPSDDAKASDLPVDLPALGVRFEFGDGLLDYLVE